MRPDRVRDAEVSLESKDAGISFRFEGREIRCRTGVSLAAALAGAGESVFGIGPNGDTRGIFCGMGVCQECRVSVDGRHGIRACMTAAEDGLEVTKAKGPASIEPMVALPHDEDDHEILTPELLVVGAGPGGLMAASIAAESGVETVVLDERTSGGGQFFKQPVSARLVPESLAGDRQILQGRSLLQRAVASGAELHFGSRLWGAFAPMDFAVFDGQRSKIYRPGRAIVATGAYERGLPLPGWTLPGVMTTGAAQGMLRSYGTLPAGRILIAGNGPLNFQIALELKRAGADVVGLFELAKKPGLGSALDALRMGLSAPRLTMTGVRLLAALQTNGVAVRFGHGLGEIQRQSSGLTAMLGPVREGTVQPETEIDADVVCMGYGFQPNNGVLRSLGCRHEFDDTRGHLVTVRTEECETNVPGVFAVGDCTGLKGAPTALKEGVIAATAVVRSLKGDVPLQCAKEHRNAVRQLRKHKRFQSALWSLYEAPRFESELADSDTVICRCENVRLQDIERVLHDDEMSIGSLKRATRLGMGPCQGRYCAPVAASLLAGRSGRAVEEFSFFAPQNPQQPIRIGDIVSTHL